MQTVEPRLMLTAGSVDIRIFGFAEAPSNIQEAFGVLTGFVLAGKVQLQSGGAFSLAKAADVHGLIGDRWSTGKIVQQPWIEKLTHGLDCATSRHRNSR